VSGPSGEQFEIAFGDQRLTVVEVGGGLRSYSAGGRELLDGFGPDEPISSGRGTLLMPWPNRLEDGAYEFDGRPHQLPLTEPERRNAIHGLVRSEAWTVGEHDAHRVVMEHVLEPQPGYPFSLALSVEYALLEGGLGVRMTAINTGEEACPFGAGQHPYVTVGTPTVDSVILSAPGRTVLRVDERGLPVGRESVEGTERDFRRPRPIGATTLDHTFTDLKRGEYGRARVELRDPKSRAGLTLWVDEGYRYLQLFTGDPLPDVQRRSLAVEPMTCPANAFRSGEDLIRLEPGDEFRAAWGIVPP
jgi:galactose mutarotase-like enzyme